MKKLLPLLSVILFLTACTRNTSELTSETQEFLLQKQSNQILQMQQDDAHIAFNMLDDKGKYYFTRYKLESIENNGRLNTRQKELILMVKNSLSEKLYTDEDERALFAAKSDVYIKELAKAFTKEEMVQYFYTIESTNSTSGTGEIDDISEPSTGGDCNCNIGSDFTHCTKGCLYTYMCTWDDTGCGFLFLYECDGKC